MSKYYIVKDVVRAIAEQLCWEARTEYGDKFTTEDWLEEAEDYVSDLPTIEVSEDCISKHDIWKIIEDNAYWVRYNENSTGKGMTLTGINQALNECPPVIPTVSEDCISRKQTIEAIDEVDWYHINSAGKLVHGAASNVTALYRAEDIYRAIESVAPSVVPKEKAGTRKEEEKQSVYGKKIRLTCCECGDVVDVSESAYPYEKYCRYCGAKMKGADE